MSQGVGGNWPGARQGDAQWSNISQEIFTDGTASVDMNSGIPLRTDTTYAFRAMISARGRNATAAAGLSGYIVVEGVISDVSGVVGAPLAVASTVVFDGFGGAAIAATATNTGNQLTINVTGTGAAGFYIHWHARVMLSEVGGV